MLYVFGDYVLDTLCYELRQAGAVIPLRPQVFQVLAYLLEHHDRVVLKQELLEHLWPGQYVGDAAVNYSIMEVRKALGDDGHIQRLLRTVRGRGYRFVAPVEVQDQRPSAIRRRRSPPGGGARCMSSHRPRLPLDLPRRPTPPVLPCLTPTGNTSRSASSAVPWATRQPWRRSWARRACISC